ncbi:MAG: hypothetical protein AB8G11_00210 [Saprospiraceae bacterium]
MYSYTHTHTHGFRLKSLSVFFVVMFSFMVSFGQNVGDIEEPANGSYPTGNLNYPDHVVLGPFPGAPYFQTDVDPYARLSIYESTPYVKGLYVKTTTSAIALQAHSDNGLAASFGKTFFTDNVGIGISSLTTASHEKLAVRNGMITTSGIGNGISLNGSYYGSNNDFGTQNYGLFLGDGSLVNLSTAQANGHRPMVLSNFWGLGFNVSGGKMAMCQNGAVYIGDNSSDAISSIEIFADKSSSALEHRLYVEKGIRTEKVKVDLKTGWADYVFESDYNLPTLIEVEQFITTNQHLPNVPSAKEVKENGIDVAQMDEILLRKIEELTLYTIEQEKRLATQQAQLEELQKYVAELSSNQNAKN